MAALQSAALGVKYVYSTEQPHTGHAAAINSRYASGSTRRERDGPNPMQIAQVPQKEKKKRKKNASVRSP